METRSGVFNVQDPAFRIIGSAVTPGNADAPSMGVLDCIEDQVLSNASDLDGIPVGREAFGTCTLQIQSPLQRYWADTLTQSLNERRHIQGLDLAHFTTRLKAGEACHIIEQVMQRGDIAHQNPDEFIPRRLF